MLNIEKKDVSNISQLHVTCDVKYIYDDPIEEVEKYCDEFLKIRNTIDAFVFRFLPPTLPEKKITKFKEDYLLLIGEIFLNIHQHAILPGSSHNTVEVDIDCQILINEKNQQVLHMNIRDYGP
ncbi:MAG: hypothetical protein LBD75_08290 [Candidatus Peribacteria bacterium]|jgi:hypothetical protein|nr:hypothetical protein [Candidatus Peribacteria bacterium]